MPQENGTGPVGAGPMTGRGAGKCTGNTPAGWPSAGSRGKGRGNRCGGYFHSHAQPAVASADAMVLQEKIDVLHRQLISLEQQLAELGGEKDDSSIN